MLLIKDSEFIRGNCPMTKEDIRALSIWKMRLNDKANVLDVGCGSGSITVQASKLVQNGQVYAIEKNEEAYEISKKNIEKFDCNNITLIKGDAIEVLENLTNEGKKFDSIFIGGSGGGLINIIKLCTNLLKESNGTMVMNFITIDNVYKAIKAVKKLGYTFDVSMVNISKNKDQTYMMIANNPIYIVQCERQYN